MTGVHNSVQLKLFAKTPVEEAGGNKTAQSAQSDALADRITQPRRFHGHGVPNRLRDNSGIISTFNLLLHGVG